MPYYDVSYSARGKLICDCPHCDGHEWEKFSGCRLQVFAHDEEQAIDTVLTQSAQGIGYGDWDLISGTATECGTDVALRAEGYPELSGLDINDG